ncbi:serine/threonine-protein phosphatase 2A regulatory subunit B'' subunit delta-like isoform X2 [Branchiostoma floridae x Branchiostoma japonicum]
MTTLCAVPCQFLGLKIPIYHSVLVDQRCSRAIHHCDVCNVVQRLESGAAIVCKSIHYGVCQPVAIPPTKARIIKKREEKATAKVSPHSPPAKPQLSPQPKVADQLQLSPQPKVVTEVKPTTSATPSPKSDPPNPAPSGSAIPRFYFPLGQPVSEDGKELKKVSEVFGTIKEGKAFKTDFGEIAKVCNCPLYWKGPLFLAAGGDKLGCVTSASFQPLWKRIIQKYHDDYSRFMAIMTRMKGSYLTADDFVPLIQDVIDTHPGLTFLQEAQEFHSRYLHTVIARIFYTVNRSWSGQISIPELRRSNLLQVISSLEEEDDINQITDFFSYEHFYVIYCKFWELDTDHDLFISQQDLARHNDGAISSRMAERIFSGAVTRGSTVSREGKMSYTEFVWFLLAEEDKKHPTAIEYWFRCMDLDGDGLLSMYELEYFYEEQYNKMVSLGIEPMPFEDCLCQMLDMINPAIPGKISLRDLKQSRMTPLFFDTFFNLEKYLDHEQRDPFAAAKEAEDMEGMSDWERYAAEEYEMLVADETMPGQDDVFDDDALESAEVRRVTRADMEEADYDYTGIGDVSTITAQSVTSPVAATNQQEGVK